MTWWAATWEPLGGQVQLGERDTINGTNSTSIHQLVEDAQTAQRFFATPDGGACGPVFDPFDPFFCTLGWNQDHTLAPNT